MNVVRLEPLLSMAGVLACLAFVLGMFDVKLRQQPLGPHAPPPPVDVSERDGRLTVEVFSKNGPKRPLAGATVRVFWEQRGSYFLAGTADSDERGAAALKGIARGALWVVAEAPGYARSSTQLVLADQPRQVRLELPKAHELEVSVRSDDTGPIERATVLVSGGDPLPYGALTSAAGVARFTRIGPSPWTVKAAAPGYESVTRSGITGNETVTLRRLGSLEVRVLRPDGKPAPKATVSIAGAVLWPARSSETDREGKTLVVGLLSGAYDLKASLGSLVSDTRVGFELGRGAREQLTLQLYPGRMIHALVSDGEGEPVQGVPNADVVLVEQGLGSFPWRGRTGKDGQVRLGPIASGPAALSARAEGFVGRSAVAVPEKPEGPVRIALLKGATLHGEVSDSKGRPIDGASIEVIGSDTYGLPIAESPELARFGRAHFEWALPGPTPLIPAGELGVMPGPVPPIPRPGLLGRSSFTDDLAADSTDTFEPWVTRFDGTFSVRPVTPGRVRALVRHPAYVEGLSEAVTLAPGGEARVKVTLYAGGSLEGRVVSENKRPVGGARIDLVALRGTLERSTVSADDGTFAFAAVPSEVALSVARPDDTLSVALREEVRVAEGEKKRIELVLPALRGAVSVRVRDARGAPVETAQVSVASLDPKAPVRRTAFTDEQGRVSIADAAGISVRVVVEAPGYARTEQQHERAPETLEVVLRRGVIVEGRVTAVRGRRPVAGATVSVIGEGLRKSALTDADGLYRVRDVAPGAVRVVVEHPDYAGAELTTRVESTQRDDRPYELKAIDLDEPAELSGRVVDPEGRPVAGARVAVGVAPAYLPVGALPAGVAISDANGAFTLRGTRAGNLEIEAYSADFGRGSVTVQAESGRATKDVEIRLPGERAADDSAAAGGVALTLGERGDEPSVEVVIVQVSPGSEAERAGVTPGDVLVSIDGHAVRDMKEARTRLGGPVSSDVVLSIQRGGQLVKRRVSRESVRR
ncbi:MAG TPA: carboxypeptidase regulatory-like domain-containing protein [Polyangiaceae bacterium]